jgi:hypothetical protein
MELRVRRRRSESYEQLRARMIAETSAYLTECLRHPELTVRIPMIPADSDRFPPSFAMSFWDPVLLD